MARSVNVVPVPRSYGTICDHPASPRGRMWGIFAGTMMVFVPRADIGVRVVLPQRDGAWDRWPHVEPSGRGWGLPAAEPGGAAVQPDRTQTAPASTRLRVRAVAAPASAVRGCRHPAAPKLDPRPEDPVARRCRGRGGPRLGSGPGNRPAARSAASPECQVSVMRSLVNLGPSPGLAPGGQGCGGSDASSRAGQRPTSPANRHDAGSGWT